MDERPRTSDEPPYDTAEHGPSRSPAHTVEPPEQEAPSRAPRHRGPLVVLAGVLAGVLIAGVLAVVSGKTPIGRTTAEPDKAGGPAASTPGWGFTHSENSADYGNAQAIKTVETTLATTPVLQNQHIMGYGVLNPEPRQGEYNFASLDRRIELIRRSGGVPVITLCCAPDWMKGGTPGQTDWSLAQLEKAPLRQHYDDFAKLSATVAQRYPDVKYFMVWNELKGFWNQAANRRDYEGYTEFYNKVYDAVKKVRPDAQIGGPYAAIGTWAPGEEPTSTDVKGPWGVADQRELNALLYWLENKRGADFVVVDGAPLVKDRGLLTDPFTAVKQLSAISKWVREQTDLPLWWAEWYVEPMNSGWSVEQRTAVLTAAQMELAASGVAASLYWSPQRRAEQMSDAPCAGCLWTDTLGPEGGKPLPFLTVIQNFAKWFPPGTRFETVSAPEGVRVLAQERMLVAVNTKATPVTGQIDGKQVTLKPYEVLWQART
jgi:hypothetical protein